MGELWVGQKQKPPKQNQNLGNNKHKTNLGVDTSVDGNATASGASNLAESDATGLNHAAAPDTSAAHSFETETENKYLASDLHEQVDILHLSNNETHNDGMEHNTDLFEDVEKNSGEDNELEFMDGEEYDLDCDDIKDVLSCVKPRDKEEWKTISRKKKRSINKVFKKMAWSANQGSGE